MNALTLRPTSLPCVAMATYPVKMTAAPMVLDAFSRGQCARSGVRELTEGEMRAVGAGVSAGAVTYTVGAGTAAVAGLAFGPVGSVASVVSFTVGYLLGSLISQ